MNKELIPVEDKIFNLRYNLRGYIDFQVQAFVNDLTLDEIRNLILCSKGTISLYKHIDITYVKQEKIKDETYISIYHSSGCIPYTIKRIKDFVKDVILLRFF